MDKNVSSPPQPMQMKFVCDGIKALAKIIKLGQLIISTIRTQMNFT
jgi:hypothetical protein